MFTVLSNQEAKEITGGFWSRTSLKYECRSKKGRIYYDNQPHQNGCLNQLTGKWERGKKKVPKS